MSTSKEKDGMFPLLPNEIISQILSDACLEPIDLYHLSLVSKKLSKSAQHKLYKHISLTAQQPQAWQNLLRSFRGNAQLLPLVRYLEYPLDDGWGCALEARKATGDRNYLILIEILRLHLPALESLTWMSSVRKPVKMNYMSVYEINPLLPVRYVHVYEVSLEAAVTLMLLPNIEKIHIELIYDIYDNSGRLHSAQPNSLLVGRGPGFSTVKDLTIRCFEPDTLYSPFVNFPRELKHFHGSLLFLGLLSPISVERYLEPVRESLVVLSVVAEADDYTDFDGTFIHFEKFKHLKHLDTSASLLFGIDCTLPLAARAGLYRRLPTTLESLTILFDYVFQAISTARSREDEYLGSEIPSDYLWITELTNLPNFKYLSMKEDQMSYGPYNHIPIPWKPHHIILSLFSSRGIKIEMSLRTFKL